MFLILKVLDWAIRYLPLHIIKLPQELWMRVAAVAISVIPLESSSKGKMQ
jgi:hypothetical protein